MKFVEISQAKKFTKPKRFNIFDTTTLFGRTQMAPKSHALAGLLRDELILRFMGRNLNAGPEELLKICGAFLYEFRAYPDEVLESAIKDLRDFSPDEIANTHLFYFIKQRISAFFDVKNIDDLIFDAAVSKELGEAKRYHPFIEEIVDNLPEYKLKAVRQQVAQLQSSRTANVGNK